MNCSKDDDSSSPIMFVYSLLNESNTVLAILTRPNLIRVKHFNFMASSFKVSRINMASAIAI